MQAAAQKYIDSSVSKTINAPNEHTVEDVEKAYTLAFQSGLKGLAYFRDGCGRAQVLTREDPEKVKAEVETLREKVEALEVEKTILQARLNRGDDLSKVRQPRPDVLEGRTRKVMHRGGSAYVTVNRKDGKPFEVFVLTGKAGSDVMMLGEGLGRLASLALQYNAPLATVAEELSGIGGYQKFGATLPHAVGGALLQDVAHQNAVTFNTEGMKLPEPATDLQVSDIVAQDTEATGQLCPECDSFSVVLEEGCSKCHVCGWSAC